MNKTSVFWSIHGMGRGAVNWSRFKVVVLGGAMNTRRQGGRTGVPVCVCGGVVLKDWLGLQE